MKILHLTASARRCGISNFGVQLSTAFEKAGHAVLTWDIEYSHMYALIQQGLPAYLPEAAWTFDVVHHNWHPITSNTFGPGHFEGLPLVSVYLHDIPPWSGCPFHDRADVRFTSEPSPGCVVLPYPIADWVEDLPETTRQFSVGVAGVRRDGVAAVHAVCAKYGWDVIEPPEETWLPFDEAVRHQARATVNVQWYHESRGKSGGASQALASRRPVVFNTSPMFSHYQAYADCVYIREDLESALLELHRDWTAGALTFPDRVIAERGWLSWGVPTLVGIWQGVQDGQVAATTRG